MSASFNPQHGLIIVDAEVDGPSGTVNVRLALDTGATHTFISAALLVVAGYDPALVPTQMQVTTGSGIEFVPQLPVDRLEALDQERLNFPVLAHTLPPSASVDGLLGLDFLRGHIVKIDLRLGTVDLI